MRVSEEHGTRRTPRYQVIKCPRVKMELKLMLSLEMMGPTKGEGSKSEQILGQPRWGYSDTQYSGYLRQIVIELGNLVAEDQGWMIRNRHRAMRQGVLLSKNNI